MTKILNMDEVTAPVVTVRMNGVDHQKKELTTRDFINLSRKAEENARREKELTMSEFVEELIDTILIAFPTMNRDELLEKPVDYLHRIVEFARDSDIAEEVAKEEGNGQEAN